MILSSSKEKRHWHLVFVNDLVEGQTIEDIDAYTSVDKGHDHPVELLIRDAGTDEEEITVTLQPVGEGRKKHTHDTSELKLVKPKSPIENLTDTEATNVGLSNYVAAKEYEKDSYERALTSRKFYAGLPGGQWLEGDISKLSGEDRATPVLNDAEGAVDMFSGFQRESRTNIKYLPVENGDTVVADILTFLATIISEQNNLKYEQSDQFVDGVSAGRGLINCTIDYESNLLGDVRIRSYPWDEVFFGPHDRKDLEDCEYYVMFKWLSRSEFNRLYPELGKSVIWTSNTTAGGGDDEYDNEIRPELVDGSTAGYTSDDFIDRANKRIKVFESWERIKSKYPIIFNNEEDVFINAEEWPSDAVEKAKTLPGFKVVERFRSQMLITKFTSVGLISREINDDHSELYGLIPFYNKKHKEKWWGKIEATKGISRVKNKNLAQFVDIVSKMTNAGWVITRDMFATQQAYDNFLDNSAKPGFVAEVDNIEKMPIKLEGSPFPAGLVQLYSILDNKERQLINLNLQAFGLGSSGESGRSKNASVRQSLVGNGTLYDNFALAQIQIGRKLLEFFSNREIFPPDRIRRMLEINAVVGKTKFGERYFVPEDFTPQQDTPPTIKISEIVRILEDDDITRYDVAVSEGESSPTQRRSIAKELQEMRLSGDHVPYHTWVRYLDLPQAEKDIMLEEYQQLLQQQSQQTQQTTAMEVGKTREAGQQKKELEILKFQLDQQKNQPVQ